MAVVPVKVAVTKWFTWRGKTEEFSNVYVYDGIDNNDTSQMQSVADALIAAEKTIFANTVTFGRVQIYSFGSVGPNFMYHTSTHSGVGAATPSTGMYRESAVMIRRKLPRTYSLTRSNQPYMRKYLHTLNQHGTELTGSGAMTYSAPGSPLSTYCSTISAPATGVALTTESGADPIGSWEKCDVVVTRQLKRGRKEY